MEGKTKYSSAPAAVEPGSTGDLPQTLAVATAEGGGYELEPDQ